MTGFECIFVTVLVPYAAVNSNPTQNPANGPLTNYRMVPNIGPMVGIPGMPSARTTAGVANPLSQQHNQMAMQQLSANQMQALQQMAPGAAAAAAARAPNPALSQFHLQQLSALSQSQQQHLQIQRLPSHQLNPAHQLSSTHQLTSAHQLSAAHAMTGGPVMHAGGSQLHPYALTQYLSAQGSTANNAIISSQSMRGSASPDVKSTPSPISQSQMASGNPVVLVTNVNPKVCKTLCSFPV